MKSSKSLISVKKEFLVKVYMTLIAQLCITFAIVYLFRFPPEKMPKTAKKQVIAYSIVSLLIVILITMFNFPSWAKLLLFTVLSVMFGMVLHYTSAYASVELITQALMSCIGVFLCMSVFAFVLASLGYDLGFMILYLIAAIIGLLVASIVVFFLGGKKKLSKTHKALLILGVIIFSVLIMVSTNVMLQKEYDMDFVTAAIDLYLGFMNVFTRLLTLEQL